MTPMICWLALPDFRQVWFLALAPLLYQPEFPMWLKNSNFSKSQNAEKSAGLWFYNVLYMWFHIPWCFHPLMFGMVNKCIFLMCGLTDRCLTRGFAASVGNGRPRSGQDYSAARACGWLEAQHSHQAATWGLLGSNLDSWFFGRDSWYQGTKVDFSILFHIFPRDSWYQLMLMYHPSRIGRSCDGHLVEQVQRKQLLGRARNRGCEVMRWPWGW